MADKVIIIGAGPAGLTAGAELLKKGNFEIKILERDSVVGGLAKTNDYKGYKFDIGPHHFITNDGKIEKWWKDLMGNDFIKHSRFTRIFYKKKFFNYPLNGLNVIKNLNIFECAACVLSYIKARLFPIKDVKSFKDWITNQFGHRLFSIFFKTYTEKVWGIKCEDISSDWASQRIKGFSMSQAIFYAFLGRWFKKNAPRTLSDEFYYPPNGSGQLWNKVATQISSYKQGDINTDTEVISIEHKDGKIISILSGSKSGVSKLSRHESDYVFSSMPLKAVVNALDPIAPEKVLNAANSLQYRGLITVNLILNKKDVPKDHWLYIHDKDVLMGRIGNMGSFSDNMIANLEHTSLSLEYFTFIGSEIWNRTDEQLLELGKKELQILGIAEDSDFVDGVIIKAAEAYPVYDEHYKEHLEIVINYLSSFSNLFLMGRNGLHQYNNMDIAMLSAMRVVDELIVRSPGQKDLQDGIALENP